MLDELLLQIFKPARYIGEEFNVAKKDFAKAKVKFALVFPDLYEVGMSNLGIRIIYDILNNLSDTVCERFFSPAQDMEDVLRNNKQEIFSLESNKVLREFDLVGFSLGHELCYTNVLNMLSLGGVPLFSAQRDLSYPLIIGGGPCVLNPEPLHEFFDLFLIGEAEDAILEIIQVYKKYKDCGDKQRLLYEFSKIEGVYVPSLYEVLRDDMGKIHMYKTAEGVSSKVHKRIVENFKDSSFPVKWLVPYIQIIHDRITMEIMRGCPNRCRFCQARAQYYPLRIRDKDRIFKLCDEAYRNTGYDEISLCGLSVSDHPQIEELLKDLINCYRDKAVSISLPSIKPRDYVGELSSLISTIKKTGLTFAPEAGTDKLRKSLGKDFDIGDFWKALEQAYQNGYQHVKLYFMIGLPGEEMSDLDGIVDFANQVSELKRKVNRGPAQVNISINVLIPKPHTAFQWLEMEDLDSIQQKQEYLRSKLRNKKIKISFHNRYMSILEGVLSRGDRALSKVIYSAFLKGAKFDAWEDHFIFSKWEEAFNECGINYKDYLKERGTQDFFAWDWMDTGIPKNLLLDEFNKVIAV